MARNATTARPSRQSSASSVQAKFETARNEMKLALLERDDEIDLVLTALLAGRHTLLVGPPGTAKSLLADSIVEWMDCEKFSLLLTKFTTPEEVFGPLSITDLKAGKYRRVLDGTLATCDVAFLDEVFKGSSAILNTTIKMLNEGTIRNGTDVIQCPLKTCIGASNEFPGDQEGGKELGALFDRFLLRKIVAPVRQPMNVERLLGISFVDDEDAAHNCIPQFSSKLTMPELAAAQVAVKAMQWEAEAGDAFKRIRQELAAEGILPGDRRLKQSVSAVQAYAWLNGSNVVKPEHLEILSHTLWVDPAEQPAKVAKIVGKLCNPTGYAITEILAQAADIMARTKAEQAVPNLQELQRKLHALPAHPRKDATIEHVADCIAESYMTITRVVRP